MEKTHRRWLYAAGQVERSDALSVLSKHSEVGIYCEGPVTNTRLQMTFSTRAQREKYQEKTCACFQYRVCPLALAADRKYDENGDPIVFRRARLKPKRRIVWKKGT